METFQTFQTSASHKKKTLIEGTTLVGTVQLPLGGDDCFVGIGSLSTGNRESVLCWVDGLRALCGVYLVNRRYLFDDSYLASLILRKYCLEIVQGERATAAGTHG